jgi:hypothetical protein
MPTNVKIRVHKTIILPVVPYGRETLSLTLREEHRLRVFENRVLRRILRSKKTDAIGNLELLYLYFSSSIIRMIKPRKMR